MLSLNLLYKVHQNNFLSKYTIKIDMKVTFTHQMIIAKADRYFSIEKVTILLLYRFHFFARSVSAVNVAQHDRRRHYKQDYSHSHRGNMISI